MATIEMIARLTASAGKLKPVAGFVSGRPSGLERVELAGKLAGLSRAATYLALAKYADDALAARQLTAWAQVYAVGLAVEQGWPVIRGRPIIVTLAAVAVAEAISPVVHGPCHGRGKIGASVCPGCGGIGYKPLSGRQLAALVGVDASCWHRHWRGRYGQVVEELARLEREVVQILDRGDEG